MTEHKRVTIVVNVVGITAVLALLMRGTMVVAYPISATTVLYDGALNTGTPNTQAMIYAALPYTAYHTFSNSVTTLDTTADRNIYAGYFGDQSVPVLDRTLGYTLDFTIQIDNESHINSNRSGFSVIVLSHDIKGIELGFWQHAIWAQHDDNTGILFTHGEDTAFDTTTSLIAYELTVISDTYTLSANHVPILTGPLRDYSNVTGPLDPYETPNFIFLGDDTTSAQALIQLSHVAVTVNVPIAVDDIISEARLDIGMPYNTNRGCPSPDVDCGGPFHGFDAGVCTDLIMDAYHTGTWFNIQNSLYQDHLANPGRYRYGTARHAEDMRRYFKYTQQLVSHSQPFQPGDIAFFDWNGDGVTDHANLISEVDGNGRPLRMVDATGFYSSNPSGLAFENDWSSYYDQHSQGHTQLTGKMVTPEFVTDASEILQVLRITVDSPSVDLRLSDENGKFTFETYDENIVASNVESFIPYIPGGSYSDTDTQKIITVTQPLSNASQYFVQLERLANATYNVIVETLDNSSISDTQLFTEIIGLGESQGIGITLNDSGGNLKFSASSLISVPIVSIPNLLSMSSLVGTSGQMTFNVKEIGGQQPIRDISIFVTDLTDQLGGIISANKLSIMPSNFNISIGEYQTIKVEVGTNVSAQGIYHGSFVLKSKNAGTFMIPFTLEIQ